jgi:hypothetical protein
MLIESELISEDTRMVVIRCGEENTEVDAVGATEGAAELVMLPEDMKVDPLALTTSEKVVGDFELNVEIELNEDKVERETTPGELVFAELLAGPLVALDEDANTGLLVSDELLDPLEPSVELLLPTVLEGVGIGVPELKGLAVVTVDEKLAGPPEDCWGMAEVPFEGNGKDLLEKVSDVELGRMSVHVVSILGIDNPLLLDKCPRVAEGGPGAEE